MSQSCWKTGAERLAQGRVATDLQFVKNTIFAKYNEGKFNKMIDVFTTASLRGVL